MDSAYWLSRPGVATWSTEGDSDSPLTRDMKIAVIERLLLFFFEKIRILCHNCKFIVSLVMSDIRRRYYEKRHKKGINRDLG